MTQVELKISGQLPSPKGIALAILELSQRDNATLGEIARVVQTDPALSGRLIKLANTASRIARPVVSVQEAVVRQGMGAVRQLALGFSLLDQYREGACLAFDYQRYWSHSLLMALSMQALGERVRVAAADEMFVCGLLAQVGRLALATAYPEAYHTVLEHHAQDGRQTLAILERTHLETDHTELGSILLSDWGLPRAFIGPLSHYEYAEPLSFPQDSRSASLILMLRLSHRLADLALADPDARAVLAKTWMSLATELDMPLEASGSFIDEVIASWRDWGALLNIPTSVLPPFAEITQRPAAAADSEAPMRIGGRRQRGAHAHRRRGQQCRHAPSHHGTSGRRRRSCRLPGGRRQCGPGNGDGGAPSRHSGPPQPAQAERCRFVPGPSCHRGRATHAHCADG